MSDQISLLRAAAHPGNTEGVTATSPTMRYRPEKCEFPIHIGMFVDGIRNKNRHDRALRYGGALAAAGRIISGRMSMTGADEVTHLFR